MIAVYYTIYVKRLYLTRFKIKISKNSYDKPQKLSSPSSLIITGKLAP